MQKESKVLHYFELEVDGKVYGPFPQKELKQYKDLMHKKGVYYRDVFLDKKPEAPPKKKREKKEHPGFDFGQWTPIHKGGL